MSVDQGGAVALRTQLLVYAVAFFAGSQVLIVSVIIPLWALQLGASPVMIGLIVSARQALVIAISLRGIGQGYNFPLMLTISSQAVGRDLQGRVAALRLSFNKFGGALVPFIMGAVAEFVGLEYAFYLVGAIGVVALAGLGVWTGRSPAFRDGLIRRS